ncbi:hypothetical protein MRS76_08030 [Rhizobiaceae bacterium n13]|uniref:Uncharacterized protein n=1 Tax=Ferirhizobium litorale TaxID=2927786 RepID=A0AAE3QCW9_9HYPH|nr:hypothetical protein [Fererhizobium litorale]MDI7861903.1 hypothetical protein [Fererhizobium litorale]MDI7922825.1 hypothetical protein [Fererhizobium litorale]
MDKFDDVFNKRQILATLCGLITQSSDGSPVEQAPCNMPLGDAILQLAAADEVGMDTHEAIVVWQGGILDCHTCLEIADQYGDRLASTSL